MDSETRGYFRDDVGCALRRVAEEQKLTSLQLEWDGTVVKFCNAEPAVDAAREGVVTASTAAIIGQLKDYYPEAWGTPFKAESREDDLGLYVDILLED